MDGLGRVASFLSSPGRGDICLEAKLVLAVRVTASSFELAPNSSGSRVGRRRFPDSRALFELAGGLSSPSRNIERE